jgi:hypothetical protein
MRGGRGICDGCGVVVPELDTLGEGELFVAVQADGSNKITRSNAGATDVPTHMCKPTDRAAYEAQRGRLRAGR